MTPEQIIEMAKQAGFNTRGVVIRTMHSSGAWVGINNELQAFAQLVRNETLEWAAGLCDDCCQEQIRSLKS